MNKELLYGILEFIAWSILFLIIGISIFIYIGGWFGFLAGSLTVIFASPISFVIMIIKTKD